MTPRDDDTPTTPILAPRTDRGRSAPSSQTFRALPPESQAQVYASGVAEERKRALSYDETLSLGATLAAEMRPLLRAWAEQDYAAGAARVADLETALAGQRDITERLRAQLEER